MTHMLSQRTVGKFQFLLEQMFAPLTYNSGAALTERSYYRLLYESGIPADLLDYIAKEYRFNPRVFVRSLHEGRPIAAMRTATNNAIPSRADREAGDRHLLEFASVALQRWVELCSENYFEMGRAYDDTVTQLMESLVADGFLWDRHAQCFVTKDGRNAISCTRQSEASDYDKTHSDLPHGTTETKSQLPTNTESADRSTTTVTRVPVLVARLFVATGVLYLSYRAWVHRDITLLLTVLSLLAASLVVPEVRRILGLEAAAPS